jgi:ribokinase
MKPCIAVVGSSNVDLTMQLPRFPRPGETMLGGTFTTAQGGKGANQAVAAARAGADVHFITRVGNDEFGTRTLSAYKAENMHLEYSIVDDRAANGVAVIFVNDLGENCIGVAPGANTNVDRDQVRKAAPVLQSAALLLLQLEIPLETVREAAAIASAAGVPVILNPAPAQFLDDAFLRSITILTPNETETERLTGIALTSDEKIRDAADVLRRKGVQAVIITLGARGVYAAGHTVSEFIPGFTVPVRDTTGAGDIFNGALAVALAEQKPMATAVRFANAAAALSVTKAGAQPSAPSRNEIDSFLTRG